MTKMETKAENSEPKTSEAPKTIEEDTAAIDLLAKLLIRKIVGFLYQHPIDFAITLLPDPQACQPELRGADPEDQEKSSLSCEQRSFLESCIVLMYDNSSCASAVKLGGHLGLDARHLPQMARILRKAYFHAKLKQHQPMLPSSKGRVAYEWLETVELFHSTSCLLLIQPDHATAWADRRRCLLSLQYCDLISLNPLGFSDNDEECYRTTDKASPLLWNQELDYLDLLVTHHSKAPSYWAHRKYVLQRLLHDLDTSYERHKVLDLTIKTKEILFAREVKTCIDVAEKFPKNYYAWNHRRYLWDLFAFWNFSRKETQLDQLRRYVQLLETELVVGMWQEWLPKHPADHSAVHYACQILDLLLQQTINLRRIHPARKKEHEENIESTVFSALEEVRKLISKYSRENYESLWILRRTTCKILWKNLYFPIERSKAINTQHFISRMTILVRKVIRDDLQMTLASASLNLDDSDDEVREKCKTTIDASTTGTCANNNKSRSVHDWSFLAWCLANLHGIDDDDENGLDEVESESSGDDDSTTTHQETIFTPQIRKLIQEKLSLSTNSWLYKSPSSPLSKFLSEEEIKIS